MKMEWAKVVKVPKSFELKSKYMVMVKDGSGYRVHRYCQTKELAQKEANRIIRLNE
jgi:hypothetical protein